MPAKKEHIFIDGIEFKECAKCHELKELKYFNKDKRRLDGLESYCKECKKIQYRKNYKKDLNKKYITVKKFIEENSDCLLLSKEYINQNTKLLLQCNCGNTFITTFKNFKYANKRKCDKCSRPNYNRTTEQFKKIIYNLVGDEYTLLSEYINSYTKIKLQHNKCGYIWDINPESFLAGTRCPQCGGSIKNKSTDYFKNEVKNLAGDEYSVLGEYKTSKAKILIRHNKCGHEYYVSPQNFLRGRRCPKCAGLQRKNTNLFKKEVKEKYGNEFEILGKYINYTTKLSVRHNVCGTVWDVTPSNLMQGSGCPYCNESRGERVIRSYLRKKHIKFESQYKINECRNIKPLPFDFAIYIDNKLLALIEYQGIQHYKPTNFGGKSDIDQLQNLKKYQKNDYIKKNFCKLNGIPLIEVSYKITNIEEYLDNEISKIININKKALTNL